MVDVPILQLLEPIRGLSSQRLDDLAVHCEIVTQPIGADVFALPAAPNRLLYVIDGELRVVFDDGTSILMVGGCDIANWPIGYRTLRPVRSKAITPVSVLSIDFDVLDLMMTWDGASEDPAADGHPDAPHEIKPSIALVDPKRFAWLPPAVIPEFLRQLERVSFRRGADVIREGEKGDYFYIIESGRCIVSRKVGGTSIQLAELKAGDCFGEAALLTGEPRNASVSMLTDGTLWRMAQRQFENLMRRPLLHDIDWSTARARVASGEARWLDVRYSAEFAEDGLPGAVNVPLNEIRSAIDVLPREPEYIVYCQSGRRSSAAAFLLAQHGFRAGCLSGGLAAVPAAERAGEMPHGHV